jgi:hypothetical protein
VPGEAPWPKWFPVEALEETKKALGAVTFSALYQQNPVPSAGAAFKREYLSHFYEVDPPTGASCVFSLDPAAGTKHYNDNSARRKKTRPAPATDLPVKVRPGECGAQSPVASITSSPVTEG